jgi:antitoxin component HigA of HigAB toxin-antitoxin module
MDKEIKELLKDTRTTEELLAELETIEPLDLKNDPEYVADFMKGMLIEDILDAMKEQGINKKELASRLGSKPQYVGRILNEKTNFTLETIASIACALGMQAQTRIYSKGEVLNITSKTYHIETPVVSCDYITGGKKKQNKAKKVTIDFLLGNAGNKVTFGDIIDTTLEYKQRIA